MPEHRDFARSSVLRLAFSRGYREKRFAPTYHGLSGLQEISAVFVCCVERFHGLIISLCSVLLPFPPTGGRHRLKTVIPGCDYVSVLSHGGFNVPVDSRTDEQACRFGSTVNRTDNNVSTTQERLRILGDDEIDQLYARPTFTRDERTQFFSFSQPEKDLLQELRSVKSQAYFVLQLGYFKAKHLFFNFDFDKVEDDTQFVFEQHFDGRHLDVSVSA